MAFYYVIIIMNMLFIHRVLSLHNNIQAHTPHSLASTRDIVTDNYNTTNPLRGIS